MLESFSFLRVSSCFFEQFVLVIGVAEGRLWRSKVRDILYFSYLYDGVCGVL